MPRLLSAAVALAVIVPAASADIDIRPAYFQTIPYDVIVDARGTPWFRDRAGIHNVRGELVCKAPYGVWHLADRRGRFWFTVGDQYTPPALHYYEKGQRIDPKVASQTVWEDSTGRVFAFDGHAVHVLTGDTWAKHTAMMPDHVREIGEARFVEDRKGRVWVWLRYGNALSGAWSFDGKTWTGHPIPGSDPGERVRLVLPFDDDWFLAAVAPPVPDLKRPPRLVPFSPSRTPEQMARAAVFAGLPLEHTEYWGEALDGLRYFFRREGGWAVTAAGAARPLADDVLTHLGSYPQGTSTTAVTTLLARPGDRLGRQVWRQGSWACGRDTQGRVYIRGANPPPHLRSDYATHVLWPEKEVFGDVLRLTPGRPGEYVKDLFRDAAGTAFARPTAHPEVVRRWNGKAWAGTPVEPLPKAKWAGKDRFPPPELAWSGFGLVGRSTATDSRTVFVRVKTRSAVTKDGEPLAPDDEAGKDARPFYVYEAWTHRDGAWSDARPPAELLRANRKALTDARVRPQPTAGPGPVLGDGARLWFAHDWVVTVTEADGTTHTAVVPKPHRVETPRLTEEERKRRLFREMSTGAGPRPEFRSVPEPLMLSTLLQLDATSVLLVVAGTPAKTYRVTFRGTPRGIAVELVEPDLPFTFPTIWSAGGGEPLAWFDHREPPVPLDWIGIADSKYTAVGHDLFALRDGRWVKRSDLYKPVVVAGDGAVWCLPTDWEKGTPRGSRLTLSRLRADVVERFAWDYGDERAGIGRPTPGAALLAGNGELTCLEPPTAPGGRATLRVLPTADPLGGSTPVVLPDGTILFQSGHAQLFDPKGK